MQRFKTFPKKSRVHSDLVAVKNTHKITCTLAQIRKRSIDRGISISGPWAVSQYPTENRTNSGSYSGLLLTFFIT